MLVELDIFEWAGAEFRPGNEVLSDKVRRLFGDRAELSAYLLVKSSLLDDLPERRAELLATARRQDNEPRTIRQEHDDLHLLNMRDREYARTVEKAIEADRLAYGHTDEIDKLLNEQSRKCGDPRFAIWPIST